MADFLLGDSQNVDVALAFTDAAGNPVTGVTLDAGSVAATFADATEFTGKTTVIYAPKSLSAPAQLLSEMLYPSDVQVVERAPGVADGITVVLASNFDGKVNVPTQQTGTTTTLVSGKYSASAAGRSC